MTSPPSTTPAATRRSEGRVLIVDEDYDALGALAKAIRDRGHKVVLAADGRQGLQRAVEVSPDVVLVDWRVPALDVRTFLEVLRDNPRTGGAQAFVMGDGDPTTVASAGHAEPLIKPFNADEVAARVDDVLRRRLSPRPSEELKGDLRQVALPDLLQVFAANRRTGRLSLATPDGAGELWVREGSVVDAAYRGAVGEKALFRLLRARQGRFVFHPGAVTERVRVERSTDQLLVRAAHASDEVARVFERLPPTTSLLSLADQVPSEASPTAGEVMGELDEPRTLAELLDRVAASDLEILEAVEELLEKNGLVVRHRAEERVSIGNEEETLALRAAAARLHRRGLRGPLRIAVLTSRARDTERLFHTLGGIEQFIVASVLPTETSEGNLGPMGVLRLEGVDIEVFALPLGPDLRPLFGALLASAPVAVALAEDPPTDVVDLLGSFDVRLAIASEDWDQPSGAARLLREALAQTTRSATGAP